MGDANILYEVRNSIGYMTINRPKFLNALNKECLTELVGILSLWKEDPDCRAIIITGTGEKAFSPGSGISTSLSKKAKGAIGGKEWSRFRTIGIPVPGESGKIVCCRQ
jgi:Enoyl-CoA hydratase/carnithine racemase